MSKKQTLLNQLVKVAAIVMALPIVWAGVVLAVALYHLPQQVQDMQKQLDRVDRNVAKIAIAENIVLGVNRTQPAAPPLPLQMAFNKDVTIPTKDNYERKN